MTEDEARTAVRTTLALMAKIAERTRTAADDLLIQIVRQNEAKLAMAVIELSKDTVQPPSAERMTAALLAVGIRS
jgi:hypothetical protein